MKKNDTEVRDESKIKKIEFAAIGIALTGLALYGMKLYRGKDIVAVRTIDDGEIVKVIGIFLRNGQLIECTRKDK